MVDEWRAVLAVLHAKHIEVTLILTPYAYELWNCSSRKTFESYSYIEAIGRKLASEVEGRVIGSFWPGTFDIPKDGFLDLHHIRLEYYSRIRELPEQPPIAKCDGP